jgi:hypothetical protein
MGNMSYCRFENTMNDLRDCLGHIHKECDNSYDENARQQMIELFMEIAEQYEGDVVGYSQENSY